jgi:hypothetical protein
LDVSKTFLGHGCQISHLGLDNYEWELNKIFPLIYIYLDTKNNFPDESGFEVWFKKRQFFHNGHQLRHFGLDNFKSLLNELLAHENILLDTKNVFLSVLLPEIWHKTTFLVMAAISVKYKKSSDLMGTKNEVDRIPC